MLALSEILQHLCETIDHKIVKLAVGIIEKRRRNPSHHAITQVRFHVEIAAPVPSRLHRRIENEPGAADGADHRGFVWPVDLATQPATSTRIVVSGMNL